MSLTEMEMSQLWARYHAMNPVHLTIDELEHELKLRGAPMEKSRSASERTLRCNLKEEKGKPDLVRPFISESVVAELEVCDDKLTGIRNHLTKRGSKKAPEQLYKTRLIHILFRMHRLRAHAKEEEDLNSLALIAGECVNLLNEYFSATSHIAEVRAAELAIINESLNNLRKEGENENAVQDQDGDENAEKSTEGNGTESSDKNGENERLGAVGGETEKVVDEEKDRLATEVEKLTKVVGLLLERITVLEANQPVSQQTANAHAKTANSTQVEKQVEESGEVEEVQDNPVDFLDWLKKRNDSIETLRVSEDMKKVGIRGNERIENEVERSRVKNRFPIHKWTVKYDGMDNGRRLNEFLKEVEFNARSEGFSEVELFQGAHHLFTQKARSWYMEVCCEVGSWDELVKELKREFLPVDIDYVYERQAGNRKQGAREKFQDFYLDMVRIFRSMSTPWDEKRKFDVLFRNTREDCRIAMLAANVDTISKMRDFGKRFDSINWHMYQRRDDRFTRKETIQVDEVRQQSSFRDRQDRYQNRDQNRGSQNAYQPPRSNNQQFQKPHWKQQQSTNQQFQKRQWKQQAFNKPESGGKPKSFEKSKPPPDNTQRQNNSAPSTSGTNALQKIVSAYIPPGKNVCFNCHEGGHAFDDCSKLDKERKLFCFRCGFPGFVTKECPYCQSKNGQKTA